MAKNQHLIVPEPMHIDSRRVALTGTGMFLVATLVLVVSYAWLRDHDHLIWLWTSLAGTVLGGFGYLLSSRHRRQGRTD